MGIIDRLDIGDWYRAGDGRLFRIVALDDRSETLEIQYSDGDLEELELELWDELFAVPVGERAFHDAGPFPETDDAAEHTLAEILGTLDHYDSH